MDVCERENIRFCSELSFGDGYRDNPQERREGEEVGGRRGRGKLPYQKVRRREGGRGKGKTPISMFVTLLRGVNPLNPEIKF